MLASLACSGGETLDERYARASSLFLGGRLLDAAEVVDRALVEPTRELTASWQWSFRVLAAEVVLERESGGVLPDLRELPSELESGALGARAEKVRGQVAAVQRRFAESEAHFDRAEQLALPLASPSLSAELLVRRAKMLVLRGEMDAAEQLALRAVERAADGADRYGEAYAHYVTAFVRMLRQRYDKALDPLEHAYRLAAEVEAKGLSVRILYNLGVCEYRLGDFDQSWAHLAQAARIAGQIRAVYDMPDIIGEVGNAYFLSGDLPRAIEHYERALSLARRDAPAGVFLWMINLAEALIAAGEWDRASRLSSESEALLRKADRMLELPYVRLHEAQIAAGRGDLDASERLYRQVIDQAGDLASLRWLAETELGRVYERRGDTRSAERFLKSAVSRVEKLRESLSRVEHRLSFLTSLIQLHDRYVEALVGQGRSEEALRFVEGSRAGILSASLGRRNPDARVAAFDPRATAARLDAVLLSYWVAPDRSYAWVVTPGAVERVTLPGKAKLEALVTAYRRFIEDSSQDPRGLPASPARTLYDTLIGPFAAKLPPGTTIVVAPDGPLHDLPFGALVAPGTPPRYLIEDHRFAVAPSLALLPDREGWTHKAPPRILAIGDALPDGREFPRLDHAGQELLTIQRTFPEQVTVVADSEARPEAYLRPDLARYTMVHIAAHAVANPSSPLDSTIVLSPGQGGRRLGVHDVLAAPLHANLVTLSACRSAGARVYSGEGLVGFSWAFLSAGARQVVAGQWDVDDRSTTFLMTRFYRHLQEGDLPLSALRQAQLDLIAKDWLRAPYHWAAFTLYLGPGTPIDRSL